jgi:hypothetical protein
VNAKLVRPITHMEGIPSAPSSTSASAFLRAGMLLRSPTKRLMSWLSTKVTIMLRSSPMALMLPWAQVICTWAAFQQAIENGDWRVTKAVNPW